LAVHYLYQAPSVPVRKIGNITVLVPHVNRTGKAAGPVLENTNASLGFGSGFENQAQF